MSTHEWQWWCGLCGEKLLGVSALHYSTRSQEGFQMLASAHMLCLTTSNIRILYKLRVFIYGVMVIALVGENGSVIGARMGINKM